MPLMPQAINVRLTDKDLERLQHLAEAYGVNSVSAVVRMLIRNSEEPEAVVMKMRHTTEFARRFGNPTEPGDEP